MNPTANTSGNPYGLSNAPMADTPLVPTTPDPAAPASMPLPSFKPDIMPPAPRANASDTVSPVSPISPVTPTAVPAEPVQPPLPPAPTLPIQTLDAPATPAVDPTPITTQSSFEPEPTPAELTIARLETEPDTSPTGMPSVTPPPAPVAAPVVTVPELIATPEPAPVVTAAPDPGLAQQFFGGGSDAPQQKTKAQKVKAPKGPSAFSKLSLPKFNLSRKQLIIAGSVVVGLLVLAAVYLFVVSPLLNKKTTTIPLEQNQQSQTKNDTPVTASVDQSAIDAATSALTQPASDEATTAGTDDSGYANDASSSAANVGNSVNESSF
jgi:hypothetical protein